MLPALLYRNAGQVAANPNLPFFRQYYESTAKFVDPKAVASRILQSSASQLSSITGQLLGDVRVAAKEIVMDLPEAPTTCCMSGCANCVWLDYAEKLSEYYKDGGEKALREINEKVSDANIRAFLLHELRMRQKAS